MNLSHSRFFSISIFIVNIPVNTLIMFSYFFLIIDLHFLIPAVITKIFNSIEEIVIPTEILPKDAKAEI